MTTPADKPPDNREQRARPGEALQAPRNVGKPPIAPDDPEPGADTGPDLAQPHERDESIGNTATEPNPVIQQAHADIVSGQVDTDLRNQPGLDAPRRAELLGGHGGGAPPPGPDPQPQTQPSNPPRRSSPG